MVSPFPSDCNTFPYTQPKQEKIPRILIRILKVLPVQNFTKGGPIFNFSHITYHPSLHLTQWGSPARGDKGRIRPISIYPRYATGLHPTSMDFVMTTAVAVHYFQSALKTDKLLSIFPNEEECECTVACSCFKCFLMYSFFVNVFLTV